MNARAIIEELRPVMEIAPTGGNSGRWKVQANGMGDLWGDMKAPRQGGGFEVYYFPSQSDAEAATKVLPQDAGPYRAVPEGTAADIDFYAD